MKNKLPSEGTVFLVPLRDVGYAVGVLARISGDGHCFGYFFGPRVNSLGAVDVRVLKPGSAVLIGKFGDLDFRRRKWPILQRLENWDRNHWPMLPLARVDEKVERAWLSSYDDAFNCVSEEEIHMHKASQYPYDRMMGSGSVEIRLTKLLARYRPPAVE